MSAPTVLLTGATGYLGRHVLRALRSAGVTAAILVRDRRAWLALPWRDEAGDVVVIEGTPFNHERWQTDANLNSITAIIHTAAIVKHSRAGVNEMMAFNVDGTLQMLRTAERLHARMIFVSTSGTVGCYKFSDIDASEDAPYATELVNRWPYYTSKIRAERTARRHADKTGTELIIVRPPVLLGPDDHRRRSTGYVHNVLKKKIPALPPGSMHFADVRDVASALVHIATMTAPRSIYHLPGHHSSLADFIALISEVSGVAYSPRRISALVTHGLARLGAFMPRPRWFPDPVVLEMSTRHWGLASLFAHEINYRSRPARDTVADTVAWLRREHHKE